MEEDLAWQRLLKLDLTVKDITVVAPGQCSPIPSSIAPPR